MAFTGFFELKTPNDLFKKLEYDMKRLKLSPRDAYAAFDFFVTAEHMLDWLYPNKPKQRTADRKDNRLLQICSHIANGSKHFEATGKHHKSVSDTIRHQGAFSSQFSNQFDIDRLEVELQDDAAAKFGHIVPAVDLAARVLDYWKTKLGL